MSWWKYRSRTFVRWRVSLLPCDVTSGSCLSSVIKSRGRWLQSTGNVQTVWAVGSDLMTNKKSHTGTGQTGSPGWNQTRTRCKSWQRRQEFNDGLEHPWTKDRVQHTDCLTGQRDLFKAAVAILWFVFFSPFLVLKPCLEGRTFAQILMIGFN